MTKNCEKGSRAEPWKITKVIIETEAGLLRWGLFAKFKRENISTEKFKIPKQNTRS